MWQEVAAAVGKLPSDYEPYNNDEGDTVGSINNVHKFVYGMRVG